MKEEINQFPIKSKPYGFTYGEWSMRWWQWLLSIPKENNPALDWTGSNININQNDPNVFFLCQTIEGTNSVPIRKNIIPSERSLFMPIINWISIYGEDGDTDIELLNTARKKMNVIGNLEIIINKVKINEGLEEFRAQSPFFECKLPKQNILDIEAGKRRFVSDGYYLFFKPFSHEIHLSTFASCSLGITKINVEYILSLK